MEIAAAYRSRRDLMFAGSCRTAGLQARSCYCIDDEDAGLEARGPARRKFALSNALRRFPVIHERRAEGLEQRAIDRVLLRVVFGVPLNAQREARGVGDADRLDRAVFRHALDDDPFAELEDALAVQRIHADHIAASSREKT